ncbi:ligase-associated DNA damage response endonuclease PdeM [Aquimarina algicola]|uniref:Ligase-associated DNA damage response endonuclease PdeM n=1 Tax=Aquimarina algicola TaxID=2589995 RepID=A0A504IZC3_9FLAO|nr:ligase-associated DNA damage response endonuclease PdeM [Aquimarina algicola]TPN83886.1 ligase-associated DNA damage response endonuclease PdeM [Aquimarina algicola]
MKTVDIEIYHQSFTLHPSGAIFWQETQMVLIADVHLGKVSHFRKHGSAVPQDSIQKNFDQLDTVISFFAPKVVCFLGDLFHSSLNSEWSLFEKWVSLQQDIQIVLVAGNHDIISPLKYEALDIHISEEWQIGSILLTHHPEERENTFNFCGHIHPGIMLNGLGKQKLKLPCFFQSPYQMILPAFGEFTGTYVLEPDQEDHVYAVTQNEVILIS